MFGKCLKRLLLAAIFLVLVGITGVPVWASKPPWSGGPGSHNNPPPVSAPEPSVLSMMAVGAFGVAGYYLLRRKRKK